MSLMSLLMNFCFNGYFPFSHNKILALSTAAFRASAIFKETTLFFACIFCRTHFCVFHSFRFNLFAAPIPLLPPSPHRFLSCILWRTKSEEIPSGKFAQPSDAFTYVARRRVAAATLSAL